MNNKDEDEKMVERDSNKATHAGKRGRWKVEMVRTMKDWMRGKAVKLHTLGSEGD